MKPVPGNGNGNSDASSLAESRRPHRCGKGTIATLMAIPNTVGASGKNASA